MRPFKRGDKVGFKGTVVTLYSFCGGTPPVCGWIRSGGRGDRHVNLSELEPLNTNKWKGKIR